jgi:cell wall-associated NlpC family hydrolase
MKIWHLSIFVVIVCVLVGCGTAKRTLRQPAPERHRHKSEPHSHQTASHVSKGHSSPPPAFAVSKYAEVKVSLQQAYRDWKGTPYVWGGESRGGVDCSGFMQLIFKRYFGVKLPRNTKRQLYKGIFVHKKDLKSGDLVFFHTGRKELHVGVIVSGDRFLHASVSQGVTISSLKDRYWKRHYMTARRVLQF